MGTSPPATQNFHMARGAPDPLRIQIRSFGTTAPGDLTVFDATVVCRIVYPGGTLDLTVGAGITLEPGITVGSEITVLNAQIVIRLTELQSRLIPLGGLSTYEVQSGVAGSERLLLMGRLIGVAGNNPDA